MSDEKPEAEKPEAEPEAERPEAEKPEAEAPEAEAPEAEAPVSAPAKAAAHDHGGDGHAHAEGDHHDHGLAHTTPVALLLGILGALLVLTILTVAVTSIDLGAQGNLIVAMVIATVKAALVCVFFMHLLWDKKFNAVLFMTSVLFLILFLSMTTTDRGEYQQGIDEYRAQQLGTK
jgi:cytochrome c oxidase subunit 4